MSLAFSIFKSSITWDDRADEFLNYNGNVLYIVKDLENANTRQSRDECIGQCSRRTG